MSRPLLSARFRFRLFGRWVPERGCCGGRDGQVRFSYPEGHCQQDQVQGSSEAALVLPDVPEAVPGRGKRPRMAPCPVLSLVQLETRAQAPDAESEGVDLVLGSVRGESASQHSRDLSLQPPSWWEPIVWKPLSSQSAPKRNEK